MRIGLDLKRRKSDTIELFDDVGFQSNTIGYTAEGCFSQARLHRGKTAFSHEDSLDDEQYGLLPPCDAERRRRN